MIPTVSSFPPLDSCPPSAVHYKRLIMAVTAPQVCSMLDLLFGSQASPPQPPLPSPHHLHSLTRGQAPHWCARAHARSHRTQLLCQRDSRAGEKGGYHMNQPRTSVLFIVLPNHEPKKWRPRLFDSDSSKALMSCINFTLC